MKKVVLNKNVSASLGARIPFHAASIALAAFALCTNAQAVGPTGLLNDTGQTLCNLGNVLVACNPASTIDGAVSPRQDGRFGRDATTPAKVGAGVAGFDFTKICQDGTVDCAGAANTGATPTVATDWACTRDNVTNLIWSLHTGQGDWATYGKITLPAAHNANARCGYADRWRLPTRRELVSIVYAGALNPSIDTNYFPATLNLAYWTNDALNANPTNQAWYVSFDSGASNSYDLNSGLRVRLVRVGP